jgi:hypothetical protein
MPGRLHKGEPLRLCESRMVWRRRTIRRFGSVFGFLKFGFLQHLIHGFPLSGPESGHTERRAHAQTRGLPQPFSSIRTLTVGFGITPNLLTLPRKTIARREEGARGLGLS